jgi:hypothetical protein
VNRAEIQAALRRVHDARERWVAEHASFTVNVDTIMRRLIHEAAAAFMSAEQVSSLSGITVKRIRALMRTYDLDPKGGKQMLSRKAAEALANNAELLGIEPSEMDLMSPLAYLPAGSELRKQMAGQQVSQVFYDEVAEFPETHYPTTPVQCACGWRQTDIGAGTWVQHMVKSVTE